LKWLNASTIRETASGKGGSTAKREYARPLKYRSAKNRENLRTEKALHNGNVTE
jgi:hypothetical protein